MIYAEMGEFRGFFEVRRQSCNNKCFVLHVSFKTMFYEDSLLRIWHSTFLCNFVLFYFVLCLLAQIFGSTAVILRVFEMLQQLYVSGASAALSSF